MRTLGMAAALAVAAFLAGCASKAQYAATKDAGKALGVVVQHCSAYGPLKTTRAEKGQRPKVRFGAAVVCEK